MNEGLPGFTFPKTWQGWLVTLVAAFVGMIAGGAAINLARGMVGRALGAE
jgi:hypothetical protein